MGSLARRVLVTSDAERKRLERALHDGVQQRLVAATTTLGLAVKRLEAGEEGALELAGQASAELARCLEDLRDLAREIYPAVLVERGLASALKDMARRAPVPVEVTAAPTQRLPEAVEIAVYRVVHEALGCVSSSARAGVNAEIRATDLVLEVRGALLGADQTERLANRIEALGGHLEGRAGDGDEPVVRATVPVGPLPNGNVRA
jgi:signal transduction histidine kinase